MQIKTSFPLSFHSFALSLQTNLQRNEKRKKKVMLRKTRLTLAMVFFLAITALFLDFTGTIHAWLGWMAKIQFLPALLALNVGVVVFLILLTMMVGRVYCSVICPLGVMQDIVSWFSGRRKAKRLRFAYSPEKRWLRLGVLGLFVIAMIAGFSSLAALIAPYSAYGRMASALLAPLYQWGNNLLAYCAERLDSYAFYETEVWMKGAMTLVVAALTFIIISVLAWLNGRTYCNTICPVGTVLGMLSRHALFRITIDKDKCNNCGLCSRQCKASCIDGDNHHIDGSRCVMCMDCIGNCRHGAIGIKRVGFGTKHGSKSSACKHETDPSRRAFLAATATTLAAAAIKAQEKKVDGGLAVIEDKQIPQRRTPIVPPGAKSLAHMSQHCTACQLCVSVCPNGVLRPSTRMETLMQPEASYERGYCRRECTRCSEVCPTGAIRRVTDDEKLSIQIGHAVWVKKNCLPLTEGVDCGNCARHCPVGAIQMIPSVAGDEESPRIPAVNTERCIGCGACEQLCPARPFSAIYVEGHERHRMI